MGHETHESRTVTWLGTDDPQRADTATINLEPERLSAHGASRTADYAASWSLTTTGNWFTENLTVSVHGQGWSRYLVLDRATDGSWRAATKVSGDSDLPEPGIEDPASLTGAVDCDLGLCPATNTMPILRLGLVHDAEAAAELTVAWVEMPSLRVLGRQQIYSGSRAYDDGTGTAAVTYSSGDFSAEIVVDSDGIVIDYPGLATRRRD
ncbi:putative glycolipid-binding domain-containing protein [Arthrobacter sulfonylureivorans]|uniref:Glycolipid-binding domain-containing protein n=1 Tax=Arthrobacter sulfonylureivorans TaxID=2486855 RepID=A0ABY3WB09_9MICC|nr:putative glycolipid-binding domain-containing protein [Arthrobacter sulfonylureivorans]UNK46646.1 putative glycolipid-binding domain-containing protein [Arthrobacter sulfonylureivorans]